MNSHDVFCPNPDCPARGRVNEGNLWIHSRTPLRYRCTVCGKTFGERAGTLYYRRSTDEATITCVVTLVASGCPPAAFGVQRQTVAAWLDAAGAHCEAVHQQLVCQPRGRPLGSIGAVQADEIRVEQQEGIVWVALVKACALPAPLLICVDGFAADVRQVRRMARSPEPRDGRRGRCRLIEWSSSDGRVEWSG